MLVRIARWCYRVSALSCSRTASVSISTEPPSSSSSYNRLQQYSPPSWTKDLAYKPSAYVQVCANAFLQLVDLAGCRHLLSLCTSMCVCAILLQLAVHHTPIHPWKLPGLPKSFQLSVKRDDMTGSTLSGNKVRLHKEVVYYKHAPGCKFWSDGILASNR